MLVPLTGVPADIGDRSHRRRVQRQNNTATTAALLQSIISDEKFSAAVQDLEAAFGAKFADFITGQGSI